MNVLDLRMGQAERFPVDDAPDRVELVHEDKVGISMVVVDGADVLPEKLVIERVVATLLELDILDTAANLKQIFDDIFALSCVLA